MCVMTREEKETARVYVLIRRNHNRRRQYSKRGIRVNVVAPGLTDTRMALPITKSESSKEAAVSKIPLNRINLPEEVSDSIFWLLTNAPDNITGQVLHLYGGMSQVWG